MHSIKALDRDLPVLSSSVAACILELKASAVPAPPRFKVVAGPDLGARSAEKAATVATALRDLRTRTTAVMVGDRSFDVLGAHANGIPAIGVTWGTGDQAELTSAGAELVIDLPAALPGAVEDILDRVR